MMGSIHASSPPAVEEWHPEKVASWMRPWILKETPFDAQELGLEHEEMGMMSGPFGLCEIL